MKANLIVLMLVFFFLSGCSSCSKSAQKNRISHYRGTSSPKTAIKKPVIRDRKTSSEKTIIQMEKIGGVYQIPVEVNGVNMYFIFDTGASIISISETEAIFLYKQGKLSKDEIVGKANFTDANGDISEGTIIVLKSVKIGNRILTDIEASVVHNLNAPLLFGQSALEKFGKISIDNKRSEITFE